MTTVSNLNLTLVNFLLDRSGSMQSIKSDVVGGFDAFLTDQRAGEGECRVTLAQFDNEYEVVYHAVPVADVPPWCYIHATAPHCWTRWVG